MKHFTIENDADINNINLEYENKKNTWGKPTSRGGGGK